ncbi:Cell division protein SepF [bioreactor metagenome]|uniref:Cell division protein SepF n=1 Tax=bioreactor metagenome TaxID=1076179 RepID=A0A645IVV7_9ZZZZ
MAGFNDDKSQKVIVCKTEKFEEARALVDQLKSNKQVVLNFENNTLPGIPQKILDYVSGAVYALDGQCQQLGQDIFVFTLASVEIIKDNRSPFGKNEIGPWGTHRG